MMNQKLLTAWAIGATVVAIIAVSFSVGKQVGQQTIASSAVGLNAEPASTDPRQPNAAIVPVYSVPDTFAAMTSQWRTPVVDKARGYAALFDPVRRKVIVEACEHTSYRLDEQGRPLPDQAFCDPVLWGQLASLEETRATVIDRSGTQKTLELKLDRSAREPRLEVTFDGHRMTMIAGSKNDLLQAFEGHPEIAARKRDFLLAMTAPRDAMKPMPSDTQTQ